MKSQRRQSRAGVPMVSGSPRRYLVLAVCCAALFLVVLDNTIVNIALPALRTDLHASTSGLQWIIDAYQLVLASLLVLGGSTGDRLGRRRIFQSGLVVFTVGSLLCSVAPSLGQLVVFRMIQAVGGSMLTPVATSIIANTFHEPRERAQAIGVWGAVIGFAQALGPLLGGVLVESLTWRSIFWINVPIGIAAVVMAARLVPESKSPHPRRIDPVGQVLVLALLTTITYGIIEGPARGWASYEIVGCFVLALAALLGLLIFEPRLAEPLLDLRFFRSVPFSGATVIAVCAFAALAGFLFLNTIYLQETRGLSTLQAGLYLLPMPAMILIGAPLSGRIVGARGPRLPLLISGVAFVAGTVPLTQITVATPAWHLWISYLLFGIGVSMANAPITNTAVSGMPREQAGVAAAIASTSRQVGGALGVAVVGAVISGSNDLVRGSRPAWWVITGLGVAVLAFGLLTTGRWARGTTKRVPQGETLAEVR